VADNKGFSGGKMILLLIIIFLCMFGYKIPTWIKWAWFPEFVFEWWTGLFYSIGFILGLIFN